MLEFWLACCVQILSSTPQLLTVYECSAISQPTVKPVVRFLHLWKGSGDFRGHHEVLDPACHFFPWCVGFSWYLRHSINGEIVLYHSVIWLSIVLRGKMAEERNSYGGQEAEAGEEARAWASLIHASSGLRHPTRSCFLCLTTSQGCESVKGLIHWLGQSPPDLVVLAMSSEAHPELCFTNFSSI